MTYTEWITAVDTEVIRIAGLSVHDLADYNLRDAYEDDVDPTEIAADILEENGWTW